MGIVDRLRRLLRAETGAGNPGTDAGMGATPGTRAGTSPDAEYERQLAALQEIRRCVADVMGSRRRLEAQAEAIRVSRERLEEDARAAAAEGRDDDARGALAEAIRAEEREGPLRALIEELRTREASLQESAERFGRTVEDVRLRREMLRARAAAVSMEVRMVEMDAVEAELREARGLLERADPR